MRRHAAVCIVPRLVCCSRRVFEPLDVLTTIVRLGSRIFFRHGRVPKVSAAVEPPLSCYQSFLVLILPVTTILWFQAPRKELPSCLEAASLVENERANETVGSREPAHRGASRDLGHCSLGTLSASGCSCIPRKWCLGRNIQLYLGLVCNIHDVLFVDRFANTCCAVLPLSVRYTTAAALVLLFLPLLKQVAHLSFTKSSNLSAPFVAQMSKLVSFNDFV